MSTGHFKTILFGSFLLLLLLILVLSHPVSASQCTGENTLFNAGSKRSTSERSGASRAPNEEVRTKHMCVNIPTPFPLPTHYFLLSLAVHHSLSHCTPLPLSVQHSLSLHTTPYHRTPLPLTAHHSLSLHTTSSHRTLLPLTVHCSLSLHTAPSPPPHSNISLARGGMLLQNIIVSLSITIVWRSIQLP